MLVTLWGVKVEQLNDEIDEIWQRFNNQWPILLVTNWRMEPESWPSSFKSHSQPWTLFENTSLFSFINITSYKQSFLVKTQKSKERSEIQLWLRIQHRSMMENVHRQCTDTVVGGGYDLEFYSAIPNSLSQNHQNWKNPADPNRLANIPGIDPFTNNNNHLSINHAVSDLNQISSNGFSINVSTGESELFIDDLIELADESMTTSSATDSSSVMSTPSPVMVPQSKQPPNRSLSENEKSSFVRSAPTSAGVAPPAMPYHSRLHEALTQPRLPTQPVRCHRCGNELTSRCLMQTCADDTRCRQCGRDLTAKCILAVCTVQPKVEAVPEFDGGRRPSVQPLQPLTPRIQPHAPPRRQRVHHYSSPSPSTSKSNLAWN